MLKRKNIPFEDSLARACKENGLIYKKGGGTKRQTITLIDDDGNETLIDRNMNVIEPDTSLSITYVKADKPILKTKVLSNASTRKAAAKNETKVKIGASRQSKRVAAHSSSNARAKASGTRIS